MSEPLVCAIMLVNGREAMVRRAVASFRAQSYENKRLLIWDTSQPRFLDWNWNLPDNEHVVEDVAEFTIGKLRNRAAERAFGAIGEGADIVCHWDSDDYSGPQRIAEQVALLQASGADAVGYYEAPFWDTRPGAFCGAWLYRELTRRVPLGASLCYWRKTWERRPFDDINHGEDTRFAARCNTVAVNAMKLGALDVDPRIVCGVHGSNTSTGYDFSKRQACFTRAPNFDSYCSQVMKLEK